MNGPCHSGTARVHSGGVVRAREDHRVTRRRSFPMHRRLLPSLVAATGLVLALAVPLAHGADELPSTGTAFTPMPQSKPLYGTQPPSKDPARQQEVVTAADGTELFVETWLPVRTDGPA